jgi:hypothetical protein
MIPVTPAATTIMVAVAMTVATRGATHESASDLAALVVADLCLFSQVARHISPSYSPSLRALLTLLAP